MLVGVRGREGKLRTPAPLVALGAHSPSEIFVLASEKIHKNLVSTRTVNFY